MDSAIRHSVSVRRKAVWGSGIRLTVIALLAALSTSCGDMVRQGTASSYLIIESLSSDDGSHLLSDVLTIVDGNPTIFNDVVTATFRLGMKDPGLTAPTSANWITIDRYRVQFSRTDGRNAPGVDIPFGFDGAMTVTVIANQSQTVSIELVRHIQKEEAPLRALAFSGVIIHAIADVTFYGHDQTGREVSVTGKMLVDFGNFADED